MINSIELFAGCGGLLDGFEQTGHYKMLGAVEWEKAPCINLVRRLQDKWHIKDAQKRVLRFDMQRTEELFYGWDDPEYGKSIGGLDKLVGSSNVDLVVGGPPCQAYSIAGRVRDEMGMKKDYRNYLFESYITVVRHYMPKAFVFENVPGILSSRPGNDNIKIIDIIRNEFEEAGYVILSPLKNAVIDMSEYGVPQNRKRIIILGLSKEIYGKDCKDLLSEFYNILLPGFKTKTKKTVRDAIGDLPKLFPLGYTQKVNGVRTAHSLPTPYVPNHIARWNNSRDIEIFRLLETDIESGKNKYASTQALKQLYTEMTGKVSNVHKYHVLKWDEPSNLIPAHLYKDGLRHIHPDSQQARSITAREAARLQTFPDDYIFYGSNTDIYKMIGNAVPPLFAKYVAEAVFNLLFRKERNVYDG